MVEDIKTPEATQEITKESGGEDKLIAYKLCCAMGNNVAGDVVNLPETVGMALCAGGMAELATQEDMSEEDEEIETADQPMLANSVSRLTEVIETKTAESVAKIMETPVQKKTPTVPASVREPIYKSNGAFIAGAIRMTLGDKSETNKVIAYQEEAAQAWNKLGVQTKSILGINETTGASGGFLVNPQFSPDVYSIPHGQIDLASLCSPIEAKSNLYNQRYINETSLANGSIFGGLNVSPTAEGASFVSSLPAWANVTLQLQKFAIFLYYTSEVLQDASYPVESELDEYCNKAFLYAINTQVIQGSTLEGAVNSPSAIAVTSSSNDTAFHTTPATSLTYSDICAIWSQVYPDCQTSAGGVWLFNPALLDSLLQMTYTFGAGGSPAWGLQYSAEEGLRGRGWDTPYVLFGKRTYPCFALSQAGSAYDIMYVDFSTFKHFRKPFRVEISKDFQFGTDQISLKFVWRGDIKSVMRNKVTGTSGTTQYSNIVGRSAAGS